MHREPDTSSTVEYANCPFPIIRLVIRIYPYYTGAIPQTLNRYQIGLFQSKIFVYFLFPTSFFSFESSIVSSFGFICNSMFPLCMQSSKRSCFPSSRNIGPIKRIQTSHITLEWSCITGGIPLAFLASFLLLIFVIIIWQACHDGRHIELWSCRFVGQISSGTFHFIQISFFHCAFQTIQ